MGPYSSLLVLYSPRCRCSQRIGRLARRRAYLREPRKGFDTVVVEGPATAQPIDAWRDERSRRRRPRCEPRHGGAGVVVTESRTGGGGRFSERGEVEVGVRLSVGQWIPPSRPGACFTASEVWPPLCSSCRRVPGPLMNVARRGTCRAWPCGQGTLGGIGGIGCKTFWLPGLGLSRPVAAQAGERCGSDPERLPRRWGCSRDQGSMPRQV